MTRDYKAMCVPCVGWEQEICGVRRMKHTRMRHMDTRYWYVHQLQEEYGLIKVNFVQTKDNVSDLGTKKLSLENFYSLRCILTRTQKSLFSLLFFFLFLIQATNQLTMANITRRTGYGGAPRRATAAAAEEGPP